MATVSVVGANGRVGRALVAHLGRIHLVRPIQRTDRESMERMAERAANGAGVVVNAAGVAHLEAPTPADLERLRIGNVELPATLAAACLAARVPLIHISSVKAATPHDSPYARSKWEGEQLLERVGSDFATSGLLLAVVRPLALLFPPLDTGKVSRLRLLRHAPAALVPPIRLPVQAPATFLGAVEGEVAAAINREHLGFRLVTFTKADRGTMRDVRLAMRSDGRQLA